MDDGYFTKAIDLLKSIHSSTHIKVGVLNLILNLIYKDSDGSESRVRKQVLEMGVQQTLAEMRLNERDNDVKSFIDRIFKKLSD